MKLLRTKKLFHGVYAYRVEVYIPDASHIRNLLKYPKFRTYQRRVLNQHDVDLIRGILKNKNVKVRIEQNTMQVYATNETDYNEILDYFKHEKIDNVTVPDKEQQDLLIPNLNLVNVLPHKKYHYKVYVNHTTPFDDRLKFIKWAEVYSDKLHFSEASTHWFHYKSRREQPFFYVENSKMLMLVKLNLGSSINRIEEYKLTVLNNV